MPGKCTERGLITPAAAPYAWRVWPGHFDIVRILTKPKYITFESMDELSSVACTATRGRHIDIIQYLLDRAVISLGGVAGDSTLWMETDEEFHFHRSVQMGPRRDCADDA
jgi:hypothetical protein